MSTNCPVPPEIARQKSSMLTPGNPEKPQNAACFGKLLGPCNLMRSRRAAGVVAGEPKGARNRDRTAATRLAQAGREPFRCYAGKGSTLRREPIHGASRNEVENACARPPRLLGACQFSQSCVSGGPGAPPFPRRRVRPGACQYNPEFFRLAKLHRRCDRRYGAAPAVARSAFLPSPTLTARDRL